MLNDLANNFWQEEGGAPLRLLPKKELSDEGKLKLCQLILGFDAETEYKFPLHDPKIYKFLNRYVDSNKVITKYKAFISENIHNKIIENDTIKLIDLLNIIFKDTKNIDFLLHLVHSKNIDQFICNDETDLKLLSLSSDYHTSISYYHHRLAVMYESRAGAYSWKPGAANFISCCTLAVPFGDYFGEDYGVYGYLYTTILGAACVTLSKIVDDYGNSIAARKKHMRRHYDNFNKLLELCYLNDLIVDVDNTFQLGTELKIILNIILKTWHMTFGKSKIANFSQLNDFQVIDCTINQLHALAHFFIEQKQERHKHDLDLNFDNIFTKEFVNGIIKSFNKVITNSIEPANCITNVINCNCPGFFHFKKVPDIAEFNSSIKRHTYFIGIKKVPRDVYTILTGNNTFWNIFTVSTDNELIPNDELTSLVYPLRQIITKRPGASSTFKGYYWLLAFTSFIAGIPIFKSYDGLYTLSAWMKYLIALAVFPFVWLMSRIYSSIMKSYHLYDREYKHFSNTLAELINIIYVGQEDGSSITTPIFRKYMYVIASTIEESCKANKVTFNSLGEPTQALIFMTMLNVIGNALKLQHDKALDIHLSYKDVDCLITEFTSYLTKAIANHQNSIFSNQAITHNFNEKNLLRYLLIAIGDQIPSIYHKTLLKNTSSSKLKENFYIEPHPESNKFDPAPKTEELLLATMTHQSRFDSDRKNSGTILPDPRLYNSAAINIASSESPIIERKNDGLVYHSIILSPTHDPTTISIQ